MSAMDEVALRVARDAEKPHGPDYPHYVLRGTGFEADPETATFADVLAEAASDYADLLEAAKAMLRRCEHGVTVPATHPTTITLRAAIKKAEGGAS